ncbi:TonB-dependent receptor [Kozakia baliensis]|uniref:TonB-dependent receptor n=1 Tax=Kozakia baliensis TaxID=153496 RepID=UPI00087DEE0C|nr:TonB-dependent receptor [Kozakia baliensis]AOX20064.1 hypothetical protein A0U90_06885 [Kozakia baliensis]
MVWDINQGTRLLLTAAWRDLRLQSLSPETYLRSPSGEAINAGSVNLGGKSYNISNLIGFRRQTREQQDLLFGANLTTRISDQLRGEIIASTYNMLPTETRQAYAANNGAQVIPTDSQGWANFLANFSWTPNRHPILGKQINFGGDYSHYWMGTSSYNSNDWQFGERTKLTGRSGGNTEQFGFYVEDRWELLPTLSLTGGIRYDHWRAFNGDQQATTSNLIYPERNNSGWSPKGVLRLTPGNGWRAQFEVARAYRFPTVTELFQSISDGGLLVQSDPNLKPESATTFDLGGGRTFKVLGGSVDMGLDFYLDSVKNTLFSQENAFTGNIYYQNIGMSRTRGVEFTVNLRGLFHGFFDFDGNFSYQGSKILRNQNLPASVGNDIPRIPPLRWSVLATIHPVKRLDLSAGVRHEGRQYTNILNNDGRRGGFGYVDPYTFMEIKVSAHILKQLIASVGVDNAFDQVRYAYHPYPARMLYGSMKWRY